MRVSAFGLTDVGRKRKNNEDDLEVVDLTACRTVEGNAVTGLEVGAAGLLLAVCDGVGGHRAGEVASALALATLAQEMESIGDGCPRRTLFGVAVEKVNRAVWEKAHDDSRLQGMSTTLTAAVLCHRRAVIAHVGDSRAYVIRRGEIRQLTRDQSFVQSLVASGALKPEEAARSPFRNVILQAIGRRKEVEVALDAIDLESGDVIVLCTDGLSEKVPAGEIAGAFSGELENGTRSLVAIANERGGDDNVTVLAARVLD